MTDETEEAVFVEAPEPVFLPTDDGVICVFDVYALGESLGFDIIGLQTFKGQLLAMGKDRRWIEVEKALEKPKLSTVKGH